MNSEISSPQQCAFFFAVVIAVSLAGAPVAVFATAAAADAASLQRVTQEMADAVAPGNTAVWDRYTDPGLTYVSEDNEVKNKTQLLADLKPLPKGFSGNIKIEEFKLVPFDGFAVSTYIMNESENAEGHALHARYRATDTWRKTAAGWKLVASQVLAIPKDPPQGVLSAAELDQYTGVYELSAQTHVGIRRDGDHLIAERDGRPAQMLQAEIRDVFFTPGRPRIRRVFLHDTAGKITGFADRREGEDLVWQRKGDLASG
ncbi:DUF4440 domain-containing protein [Pseudolysobacter antarcticus]|nr:DUF4440 domain-containing protein [Pseudolysobacter antarcticus]